MKRQFLFLLVLALLLSLSLTSPLAAQEESGPPQVGLRPDAPTYALHGPYWVGTREFVIEPESERPLPVTVWYPALNPEGKPEEISYVYDNFVSVTGFTQAGYALADAAPDAASAPYPLVILSHGNIMYRYAHAYLAEHLASQGFVVLAIDHTGNTVGYLADPKMKQADWSGFFDGLANSVIERPNDVQRQIAYASALTTSGDLPGLIDLDHIAVVGHSTGGYAALASVGAQVDLSPRRTWCTENANDTTVTDHPMYLLTCQVILGAEERLLSMQGLDTKPGEMWPPFDVTGVDAIVSISPAPIFAPESFKQVTVPALLMVGTKDSMLGTYEDTLMTYDNLPSEQKGLVQFEKADHFFPLNVCQQWFNQYAAPCGVDATWNIDHAHDLINHFTTAFLLDKLKGDKDAHDALLAENVSFPGITYETTMK